MISQEVNCSHDGQEEGHTEAQQHEERHIENIKVFCGLRGLCVRTTFYESVNAFYIYDY